MLEQIIDIVRRAGDIVLSAHDIQNVTREKHGPADLVTQYDEAVQVFLRQELLKLLPEAEFFGEETGRHGDNPGLRFIVDPIDGTRAFIRGLPTWSVLVGIEADGVPVAGIAYMPAAGDLFAAVQGNGATHNGAPGRVSKVTPLADATVTHGCLQQFTEGGVGDALVRLANACDSARGFPDFDGYRQVLLGRSDAMVDPGVKP